MKIRDPQHYIESQFDSAMAEYTAAISIDSSCVDALTNRGVLRDIRGDRDGAIKDYTLALRINPTYAEAYSKRAATYRSLGRDQEALADYTAAIKLDSSSYKFDPTLHFANAYFGRGVLYFHLGELDKAIADYDSVLVLSPNHSMAILNRAIALSDKKLYDASIAGYTRAIALLSPAEYNGARYLAYLRRGNAYKALGTYDKAIDDYKKALESPEFAGKACWRIAECYCLKKEDETSIDWLRKAVSSGFTDVKAWRQDADLAPLRKNVSFQQITNQ
jgi:tetratricopeptide (TPR) repeat protein